jgi:hypothetical protein
VHCLLPLYLFLFTTLNETTDETLDNEISEEGNIASRKNTLSTFQHLDSEKSEKEIKGWDLWSI